MDWREGGNIVALAYFLLENYLRLKAAALSDLANQQ